jgi:hypothetical protein
MMMSTLRPSLPELRFAVLLITLALLGSEGPLAAQSLAGTTGLVAIPTAHMPRDGTVALGVNHIDRRHHGYDNPGYDEHSGLVEYASIGFLPFVEVGLRLTRVVGVPRLALGDRMVSVRLRLVDEGARTPAVVVGAHDLVGTRRFHTVYAVASRSVAGVRGVGDVSAHLGVGGDPLGLGLRSRGLRGAFGGVSVSPVPPIALMAEYDGGQVNAGVRLRLGRFALLAAAQDLEGFSGGLSYTQPLH